MYMRGKYGVPVDKKKGAELLTKAAEQRADPATMYTLAMAYRNGDNGCQDLVTARLWFEEAAHLGHPQAQLEMSRYTGPDVEKWLLMASEHGVGEATRVLALTYVQQREMSKLMQLLKRCSRRFWQRSSKAVAAPSPSIPLLDGV